ncbi:MAG: MBL fold metallo-hydrolase [Gaiellaceae bacterium]
MLFRQFVNSELGCASYLVGDERTGAAFLVDPAFAIEQYPDDVRLVGVLETHTHADHVSGHGRLALERDVPVWIHPLAEPDYPFEALEDGRELELGDVTIRVLHTPGHRPEHCSFLVLEHGEPRLVLTGDSLFVGDAARPDLAVEAREGARDLFGSLARLAALPEDVAVYPGHVAGSLCGGSMSADPSSTIGAERRGNHALAFSELEAFVNHSAAISTPRPPNVARIVELNRGPWILAPVPLEPVERDEETVLDVRPAAAYVAGHVPGALNVPVSGGSFGTKAGFVLSADEQVALHASSPAAAERAAWMLWSVGFLDLAGYLDDPETPDRVEPVDLDELEQLLAGEEIELIDVRDKDERDGGYIAGSRNIPYRLLRAYANELAEGQPVVTICESGPRAAIAASILVAAGVPARPVLEGGIGAWQARGGSTIEFRRCGS